jgi:hypothetical protein
LALEDWDIVLDFDKFAGRFAVIVPIVHLVTCGLYMAGYSVGFGGNIGGLFSASDFFTITIQHLIATYVLSLGMPVIVILLRYRSGLTYASDIARRENDPVKKAELIAISKWANRFLMWVLPLLGLNAVVLLVCQMWTGAMPLYNLVFAFFSLVLMPAWWKAADLLKLYGLPVELAWCCCAFVVGVVGLGMDSGDRDRRMPYILLSDARMHCGDHAILSPIGDRFISVTPNNRRHLINDDCKVQFDFMPTAIIPQQSLYDLVKAKLDTKPQPERTAPLTKPKA